ncbi:MFS general substrate transporter [Cystobasidium minutum MCA 4210]|uniref:MFS general substrate transporter n=1 Tax=Cystobasidium minutum MCA 4210 TaxID=1397322 RepID=UPI0034CE717C|eukprot:jgi/Rhomi1/146119/e_gw1.6.553.1
MQKVLSGKGVELIYVGWNGPDDPANPRNWSHKKKWIITAVGCLFCSIVSLSFSAYSIAINDIAERLDTSYLLSVAGVSLFTLTFGVAPLILAPLSEIWGRRPAYVGSAVIYTLFQIPQALATNIQTMLVARFIAGIGGSTAVAVLGGTLADLFSNEERGIPMAIFATVAFASTSVAPSLFGYLVQFRGFRPVMWIQFALSGALVILLFFLAKETRADVLLSRKAKKLRLETGDQRFATQAEEERASIATILKVALTRPFHLLFTEPIIQAFTTLLSFVYAVLYLLLVAIPIVYARVYHFNTGQIGLIYLSQAVGTILGAGVTVWTNRLYHKNVAKRGAEARLYSGMVGGVCLPVGSWIFAWGSMPSVHWIVPSIGIGIIYGGIFLIYTTCFNFLADSYTLYASSALSILNVWRNLLGAAFPLFCADLYDSLGVQGAGSLVAGLSTLVSIIPFIGFHYGARLRANSRYAKEMAAKEAKMS